MALKPGEKPSITLKPGEQILITGPSPLAYNRDDKTKTRVRVTAPGPYVPPPVDPPPVDPPVATDDPKWAQDVKAALVAMPKTYAVRAVVQGVYTGSDINQIIAMAPQKTSIVVAPGSVINLTGQAGIDFRGHSYLELVLIGVTVNLKTDGTSNAGSAFILQNSHWVKVKGGWVQGQNPNTGTAKGSATADEQKNGVAIRYDCDHIEFESIVWRDIDGFGVFISSDGGVGGPKWPQYVWFRHTGIEGGVMAYGIVSVRDLIVEDSDVVDTNWFPFDFEPDNATEGYERVLIQRNTIDRFGWEAHQGGHTHWLLAMNPASSALGAVMRDLTFRDNHVIRGHVPGAGANAGGGGLLMRFDKANIKDGLVITGNVSDDPRTNGGSPIQGNAVRNAVITGNKQKTQGAPLYVHGADDQNVPDVNVVATPNVTT